MFQQESPHQKAVVSRNIRLEQLKKRFRQLPLPNLFSRIVTTLLDHIDRETLQCWPSRSRIATLVGCSERAMKNNLSAIKELQLFHITNIGAKEARQRFGPRMKINSRHRYNIYTLKEDNPLWHLTPKDSLWQEKIDETIATIRRSTHKSAEKLRKGNVGTLSKREPMYPETISTKKAAPHCAAPFLSESQCPPPTLEASIISVSTGNVPESDASIAQDCSQLATATASPPPALSARNPSLVRDREQPGTADLILELEEVKPALTVLEENHHWWLEELSEILDARNLLEGDENWSDD